MRLLADIDKDGRIIRSVSGINVVDPESEFDISIRVAEKDIERIDELYFEHRANGSLSIKGGGRY